jgi:hypothetical protein
MNEKNAIEGAADVPDQEQGALHDGTDTDMVIGIQDAAATIPKGEIDPVYEAKARVLNRAACFAIPPGLSRSLFPLY